MATESRGAPARLAVVGDAAADAQAGAAAPAPAVRAPRAAGRTSRVLALLLLLTGLALVVQTARVDRLEERVAGLGADLDAARQEIESYEGRLGRVRDLVDDLGLRLEELRAALEPVPGAPAGPEEAL